MSCSRQRGPFGFGPVRLPADAFVEIEPTYREKDGRKLRRYYLKALGPEMVFTEDPMDQTFNIREIKREPMKIPTGGIFYLDYQYGEKKDDG